MTENAKGTTEGKRVRLRSPNYPAILLQDAIEKARQLWDSEKRNAANVKVVAKHWGYNSVKSSGLLVSLAALKAFGLTQDTGSGDNRRVQLTDLAQKIILDARSVSPERDAAIRQAALQPKMHSELWNAWDQMPSDENLRHELIVKYHFNENTVGKFIEDYKETIRFAKLTKSDTVGAEVEDSEGKANGGRAISLTAPQHPPLPSLKPNMQEFVVPL
jgi:hypothetical protein